MPVCILLIYVCRYVGHAFKFVAPLTQALVARLVMRADTTMYVVEPAEGDAETRNSAEYLQVSARLESTHAHFS